MNEPDGGVGASSVSACDVHSSIVMPPTESGSLKATLAQAWSVAASVVAAVAGLTVGGTSESAVGGAVAALVIAAESTLKVSVVFSSKSIPRLPPVMSTGPNLKASG